MNQFDRVKILGTGLTGTVIEIQDRSVTVALDSSLIEIYDVSEVKLINRL